MLRTTTIVIAALLLSACVVDARSRDTRLEPVRSATMDLAEGAPLRIRIPAGDVRIVRSDDRRVHAELEVFCPDLSGRCADKLSDLDFVVDQGPTVAELRLNRNRSFAMRHGRIVVRIAVPQGHPLDLDVTAGDVDVNVANCVVVDMEAGDLHLRLPASLVRSVDVDTGVGDASLRVEGRTLPERRSLLIGAEVHWRDGSGTCAIAVDLQAGDARVELS